MLYILVTGTNGGLGLGICTRLIDDFLRQHPPSTSLTLMFTTRSQRKGNETLQRLRTHLNRTHPPSTHNRIHLRPELVDLTNLLSIRALATRLLTTDVPHLNTLICNAGVGGWAGLNWGQAVYDFLTIPVVMTAWPRFKLGIRGLITDPQLRGSGGVESEPVLAQVFCANVFGHYMLAHWLMPLMRACEADEPAKLIWVGSIEPCKKHFDEDDLMGLTTDAAYESTKRLTDVLALTAETPAARESVLAFMGGQRLGASSPMICVAHPGTCATAIVPLPWVVFQLYVLGVYVARVLGNPWANVWTYLGASVFSWLALASREEVEREEKAVGKGGRVKWGASTSRLGVTSVRPTDVEGWGIGGTGEVFGDTWWGGGNGRVPGAKDARREDVQEFEALGARVWVAMEEFRVMWEGRIEEFEKVNGGKL